MTVSRQAPAPSDELLPPSDMHAERAVLGACLANARALDEAADAVRADDFYRPAHGELFGAMLAMRNEGKAVDVTTFAAFLGNRITRLGGHTYLLDLYGSVATSSNVGYYAEIVTDLAIRRRLIEAGQRTMQLGYLDTDDPIGAVERARMVLDEVAQNARRGSEVTSLATLARDAVDRYGTSSSAALATGWSDLDAWLSGGLRPGTVTIVGARTGVGKTLVATNVAAYVALSGHSVGFMSLEMTKEELYDRFVSNLTGVPLDNLTRHDLSASAWAEVSDAARRLASVPLSVVDNPYVGLAEIRSHARDLARSPAGLSLLVVDYLGLVRPADTRPDRREQVDALSRGMKLLAKELRVPVLLLHQLNRGPEHRSDKTPMLSDLRESGAIEQDADVVWLLHRDATNPERMFDLDVHVAKNRQGPTGTITLTWQPQVARITGMPSGRWDGE
jgi:replicative DNA helicase